MGTDSSSRWRLIQRLRSRGAVEEVAKPLDYSIRSMKAEDAGAVTEIYNFYVQNSVVTFDENLTNKEQWLEKIKYLSEQNFPAIIAESSNGEILGFAYVFPWRQKSAYRKTVENSIYLRPAATRKRIGTELLAELIKRSSDCGIREIIAVISDQGAEASIKLHEQFGFTQQGHLGRVGFKFGRWLGTVLLQKSL